MNGAQIIALNVGRYYKSTTGLNIGVGAFVKGLEYSTNQNATVIGKPAPDFFKTALENVKADEAIMIGDVAYLSYCIKLEVYLTINIFRMLWMTYKEQQLLVLKVVW